MKKAQAAESRAITNIVPAQLQSRIWEAAAWAEHVRRMAGPESGLRTRSFVDGLPGDLQASLLEGRYDGFPFAFVCELVAAARREVVENSKTPPCPNRAGLIVYDATASFLCGLACKGSHGYFDDRDCPPWDTWLCYGRFPGCIDARGTVNAVTGVLALVPPWFLSAAREGFRQTVGFGIHWWEWDCAGASASGGAHC